MRPEKSSPTDPARLWRALNYSLQGIAYAWRNEAAFKHECILAPILAVTAFFVAGNHIELILLIGSLMLVLIAELINSAIEAVVDRISEETHPLSGSAKDLGSAAVFLAMLVVVFVWALIVWQRYFVT